MKERLEIALTLKAGGAEHSIVGGDVRAVHLRLTPWGAEGSVAFVVQDDKTRSGKYEDKLLSDFQKPDLAEISLSVKAAWSDSETSPERPPIEAGGIVVGRRMSEKIFERGFEEPPVLYRRYEVRFIDPARALWGQHHPTSLHVEQSFQDVIDANKGDKITITYDWDTLSKAAPMIYFRLEPERGASFYDLVVWYADRGAGVLTFDASKGTYKLAKTKDSSGTAVTLPRDDVADPEWEIHEPVRHAPRVLNVAADSPKLSAIANADAATGIFLDVGLCTDVAQDVDDRVTLETSRVRAPQPHLILPFMRFPSVAVAPGSLVTVSSGGGFSTSLRATPNPLRVVELSLDATALDQGPERDYGDATTTFDLSILARLEDKTDAFVHLPPFKAPRFPGYVEGKVLSEVGEDTDVTYQIYQNADTSIDEYKIEIPAFESKQIKAPYMTTQATGTFYVPVYKHAKVRVACFFGRAEIVHVLDHRLGAKVAQDGQGQHLLFGKSEKSQTSLLHDYQDDKPVLRVLRTNDKDTVLVKLEEGKLTLRVEETKGGS
jgi:hypothetical protein